MGKDVFAVRHAIISRLLTVLLGVASSIIIARGQSVEGRGRFLIAAAVLGTGVQVIPLGLHALLPWRRNLFAERTRI